MLAIRNLQRENDLIAEKIKIIGSLYCGHLKTENYSKYIADDIFYEHGELEGINFRLKAENEKSSNYMTEINTTKGNFKKYRQSIKGTNWGLGLFKYKSCDFCEDVSGDLADFSLGDAWLPKYEDDDLGTNLVIVRSQMILDLLNNAKERIFLEELSDQELFDSQAGGYRHKREGIHVRNKLLKKTAGIAVKPRYKLEKDVKLSRKIIYWYRVFLRNYSLVYIHTKKNKMMFKLFSVGITFLAKFHALLIKADK